MLARDALGLGLRIPHYAYLREHAPTVGFFELISENFLGTAAAPRRQLDFLRERYPLVLHGVSLDLLGDRGPQAADLDQLAALADYVDAAYVTDHLCWTASGGLQHHDLLPTPYVDELVGLAAERAKNVQAHLGRPFGLENLSSYVAFRDSTMSEAEFYRRVVEAADCHYLLDINNVYVSSVNHDFDPSSYLEGIDFSRVLQVHLAGHTREAAGNLVDTHDAPVCEAVWELYRQAWQRGGPFPTLLEWDAQIPEFPELLRELERAQQVRA